MENGDRSWFEPLVQKMSRPALKFAYLQVQDIDIAEEIVQEAFVRVWAAPGTPRTEPEFHRWLYRAIVNLAIDAFRDRQRFAKLPIPPERVQDPSQEVERKTTDDILLAALQSLPLRERQAVYLRYFEDQTLAETTRLMGMHPVTLRVLIHRALGKLRAQLAAKRAPEAAYEQ